MYNNEQTQQRKPQKGKQFLLYVHLYSF